ncbi:MAG: response regulator transcription factor [Stenomitos rutilans HA7619-LM2]|jgi:DNA-binding NarL/FixJ family response regulator|nr:response regulator transcription factor [Stenomitos rutilans HA7619-LM2]
MQQNLSTTGSMIRVLVAASSVVMQAGLEALLSSSSDIDLVSRPTTTETLTQQIARSQPDVVLWEWNDAETDGIPAVIITDLGEGNAAPAMEGGSIESLSPAIVVMVDDWQPPAIASVLNAGVRGILPSDATATEFVGAIVAAARGLTVIHPDLLSPLLSSLPSSTRATPIEQGEALTNREVEVLTMLAEGLGNKAIARRLNLSEHTVKFHIGSIFSKLHASSRTEAVILGARQGLILL